MRKLMMPWKCLFPGVQYGNPLGVNLSGSQQSRGSKRVARLHWIGLVFCIVWVGRAAAEERLPNIVYIMSDELAYYELSLMGNPRLRTPNIDRMAREGVRFTQALAAAPVCGPLRACLMTGKHMGHCSVRDNPGGTPLRAEEPTIASMLKARGYATGGFGKWGAGGRGSTGVPEQHGFDVFFGYYDQVHAHSFYPPYLIRNSQEVPLPGNAGGRSGKTYSHYEIMKAGKAFIRENRDRPFFCYLPVTPPHGMYDIPSDDPAFQAYRDDAWFADPSVSQEARNYAAMVTMIDNDLQSVLDLLRELGLEENTIVFFTGDNGGQDRFSNARYPRGFFGPNVDPKTGVEFRGGKGSLYEGGLRIPYLVRWPGKIAPGRVSDLVFSQIDVFPTLAELTSSPAPEDLDGMSILTELLGAEVTGHPQSRHPYLYWEYGSMTAVRMGKWKAVQTGANRRKGQGTNADAPAARWALYDLDSDVSESMDVAPQHAEVLAEMVAFAEQAHQPWKPGSFSTNELQMRDRNAKWGSRSPESAAKQRPAKPIPWQTKGLVPAKSMKLVRFSSQNQSNDKLADYAMDGDPTTLWHSRFTPDVAQAPHELVIDLNSPHRVREFRYLARQDGGWNGAFAKVDFTVSSTPDAFGEPDATATLTKTRAIQSVKCPDSVIGRYIRVRAHSEVNGGPWASASEIGVIGTPVP